MSAVAPSLTGPVEAAEPLSLQRRRTALGSEYLAFFAEPGVVRQLTRARLEDAFRRVVLDPARGLVVLMSPSALHEIITGCLDKIMDVTVRELGADSVPLRSVRWRRPQDPQNSGAEPDCSYYLGDTALAYLGAVRQGEEQEQAFADTHAPDLVVEVGVTHVDRAKRLTYRDLGAREYWHVKPVPGTLPDIAFLDLQAPAEPAPIAVSRTVPGMTPDALAECLRESRRHSSRRQDDVIRRVLRNHGVIAQAAPGSTAAPA